MRTRISLSLLSMSIVSYEIHLMHFFSIVQWQHFASMVISIALLGFGASGTVLSLYRKTFLKYGPILIPLFMITSALLMAVSFPLSRLPSLRFDSYTLFVDQNQIGKLLANYLLFFLPFFFGALAIGLLFVSKTSRIGRYYFADLLGAGLGGLLALLLMWSSDFSSISLIISSMALASGLLAVQKLSKGKFWSLLIYALGCIALFVFLGKHPTDLTPSSYKSISYALNLPDARIQAESHSPYGLLQVVRSPVQRYAPGLSLSFQQGVPSVPVAFNNGNWLAAIPVHAVDSVEGTIENASGVLDFTTMALPYHIRPLKTALQVYAGAGFEVVQALDHEVQRIDAIEPNAAVLDLLRDDYAMETDSLYFNPGITWHQKTPRSFLQETDRAYELIQLPLMGAFGGTVGLDALDEDWILTREGLEELWNKLDAKGMLSVSCWIDVPQKMSIRISALIAGLFHNRGIRNPDAHLLIIRSWGTLTFLISKSPWSQAERAKASEFCKNLQFDLVGLGDPEPTRSYTQDLNQFNLIQDQDYENNLRATFRPESDSFIKSYPFNVRVPTDDKPYFFQFLKLTRWSEQKALWGESPATFIELGYFLVLLTFGQLLFFALLFILLPLIRLGWKGQGRNRTVIFFSSLGLGYMFVEIILMKYFQIFLGHPIYSIAMVISVMLISSGLGSRYSERYGLNPKQLRRALLFVSLVVIAYALFLGFLLRVTVGTPLFIRLIMSLILIGIPAFFMGMPFPLGLKLLDAKNRNQVPWAWGINGCVSVISTTLAAIVALELGFTAVLLLAGLAYALARASVRST